MATKKQRRVKKKVPEGLVTIQASFNNTIVTISNPSGDVLCFNSAGQQGFKGSRKATPFAAQQAASAAASVAVSEFGMTRAAINVSGPGAGRESAMRAVRTAGIDIIRISDTTPIPHNGCRPRKKRRV